MSSSEKNQAEKLELFCFHQGWRLTAYSCRSLERGLGYRYGYKVEMPNAVNDKRIYDLELYLECNRSKPGEEFEWTRIQVDLRTGISKSDWQGLEPEFEKILSAWPECQSPLGYISEWDYTIYPARKDGHDLEELMYIVKILSGCADQFWMLIDGVKNKATEMTRHLA